jgi:putative ABC transport system permease protein
VALQSATPTSDLVIRTSHDPLSAADEVQRAARALNPRVVIERVTTMDAIIAREIAPWRLSVWMFGVFATLAFVLAAVGLVSVVSLDVANRRHEFAVRTVLGAARSQLVRSAMARAGWRVLVGVVAGVCAAMMTAHGIRSILFGVSTLDPATYGAVVALVAIVVAVASYVPARRSSHVEPAELLRRGSR